MHCCMLSYLPPEQAGLNIVVFTFLNQKAAQKAVGRVPLSDTNAHVTFGEVSFNEAVWGKLLLSVGTHIVAPCVNSWHCLPITHHLCLFLSENGPCLGFRKPKQPYQWLSYKEVSWM